MGQSRRPKTAGDDRVPEDNPAGAPKGTVKSTLLIVEDEIFIRLGLADYLREHGYVVVEAATGEQAQRVFGAQLSIDLVISDINPGPGMNGFALARWIRERYPAVWILFVSAEFQLKPEAEALCDGPMILKPYSHSDLVQRATALLQRGRRTVF